MKSMDRAFLDTVVGLAVQACRDMHVVNIGAFASEEGNLP